MPYGATWENYRLNAVTIKCVLPQDRRELTMRKATMNTTVGRSELPHFERKLRARWSELRAEIRDGLSTHLPCQQSHDRARAVPAPSSL